MTEGQIYAVDLAWTENGYVAELRRSDWSRYFATVLELEANGVEVSITVDHRGISVRATDSHSEGLVSVPITDDVLKAINLAKSAQDQSHPLD